MSAEGRFDTYAEVLSEYRNRGDRIPGDPTLIDRYYFTILALVADVDRLLGTEGPPASQAEIRLRAFITRKPSP